MPKSYILAWPVPYQVQFCAAARHAAQLLSADFHVCLCRAWPISGTAQTPH